MRTICIKSNDEKINNYIISNLQNIKLDTIYLSVHKFSIYTNLIIHYKGNDITKFLTKISNILTNVIIIFYNKFLINNLLNINYFYFSNDEKLKIYKYCIENCNEKDFSKKRKNLIKKSFINYFSNNKKIILNGFVNFALKDYLSLLDTIIDQSINNYLVEKEYFEFIELLKCYVNSQKSSTELIYLLYVNDSCTLLNEKNEIIPINKSINNKYLSDISFSNNDYCLNTLLTLLPKRLIILYDTPSVKDDFLNTLELIFENRIYIKPNKSNNFTIKKDTYNKT